MSIWLLYASYVAAVNPARLRPALPERAGRAVMRVAIGGAVIALALGAALVAGSTGLLDALDVTHETFRIAAGIVVGVVGLRVLAFPERAEEPRLRDGWSMLVPVLFPLLVTPELVALVTVFGATEPASRSIGGLAVALAAGIGVGRLRVRHPTLWLAVARILGAVLILSAAALIVEGVRDV